MQLSDVAQNVCWWKAPAEILLDPKEFLTRIMVHGTLEEIQVAARHFPESLFRDALVNDPLPGLFDEPSWTFWHAHFGIYPPPPLPCRRLI